MSNEHQKCPICKQEIILNQRYVDLICLDCVAQAVNENKIPVTFCNTNLDGSGFKAIVKEKNLFNIIFNLISKQPHVCYINGVKCWADEAYMGGIVVRPFKNKYV